MDLAALTDSVKVALVKHSPFAKVWSEVMNEHASFYVGGRGRPAIETEGTHQLRG
jgi:hypothetical protein